MPQPLLTEADDASRSLDSSSGTVMKYHGDGPFQAQISPSNSRFTEARIRVAGLEPGRRPSGRLPRTPVGYSSVAVAPYLGATMFLKPMIRVSSRASDGASAE